MDIHRNLRKAHNGSGADVGEEVFSRHAGQMQGFGTAEDLRRAQPGPDDGGFGVAVDVTFEICIGSEVHGNMTSRGREARSN